MYPTLYTLYLYLDVLSHFKTTLKSSILFGTYIDYLVNVTRNEKIRVIEQTRSDYEILFISVSTNKIYNETFLQVVKRTQSFTVFILGLEPEDTTLRLTRGNMVSLVISLQPVKRNLLVISPSSLTLYGSYFTYIILWYDPWSLITIIRFYWVNKSSVLFTEK